MILLGDSGTLILGGTLIAGFMESAGGCGRLRRPGQLPNSVSCCLMGGRTGEGNRFTLHFSNSYISLLILWLQELFKSEYFGKFEKSQGHQGKYVKISFHFDHLRCGHKRFLQHVGKVADFWHQIEFWDLVSPDHKRVGDFLISNLRHPNV